MFTQLVGLSLWLTDHAGCRVNAVKPGGHVACIPLQQLHDITSITCLTGITLETCALCTVSVADQVTLPSLLVIEARVLQQLAAVYSYLISVCACLVTCCGVELSPAWTPLATSVVELLWPACALRLVVMVRLCCAPSYASALLLCCVSVGATSLVSC